MVVVKLNSSGEYSKAAQKLLVQQGYPLVVDGEFGPKSEAALVSFQNDKGLLASKVTDVPTWRRLLDTPETNLRDVPGLLKLSLVPAVTLSPSVNSAQRRVATVWNRYGGMLTELAGRLSVPISNVLAVMSTESAGSGLAADHLPIRRFENHIFYSRWAGKSQTRKATFNGLFQFNPDERIKGHAWRESTSTAWEVQHTGEFESNQARELKVLLFAESLGGITAYESASFGLAQIMGFNALDSGYADAKEMFDAFKSEGEQILGFFEFVRSDPRRFLSLRETDVTTFTTLYNGPGNVAAYSTIFKNYLAAAKAMGV